MQSGIIEKIEKLKKEKNAVIMAHYYAPREVQEIADYVGDSYYLARLAVSTDKDIVVLCGVKFMGESVKILNPNKKVLMPNISADCPMAHMADVGKIAKMREEYDDLAVACYINSTAELKSVSDICVTSSNAVKIVERLENRNIYFIPDKNLGTYVKERVSGKNIILNDGCCPIHASVTAGDVKKIRREHPEAKLLCHPECIDEVVKMSDFVGSTAEIIDFAKASADKEFIISTEDGVGYALMSSSPDKSFVFVKQDFECADMKMNTLDAVLSVLENEENEILLDEELMAGANRALVRMLELAK